MKVYFFFISVFLFTNSFSQQPAYFILGEKEFEGVQIYDVIQDNRKNYWFATDQGFFKYDNYKFESVECEEMKGLAAFGFVKSKQGIIFGYNLNNQIIKIENGKCSVFYELKGEETSNDVYLTFTQEDQLMVLTRSVLIFDLIKNKKYSHSLRSNYYSFPFLLSDGRIISHMANTDSLLVFDKEEFRFSPVNTSGVKIMGALKFFILNSTVHAISTEDKRVFVLDENDLSLTSAIKFDDLNEREFYRFYNERGHLWMAGTVSGVRKMSLDNGHFTLSGNYYKDFLISDVFEDSEGNILLSTFNHGVMVVPHLEIPDVLDFNLSSSIVSTQLDEDFGLLLGTLNGELISYDTKGLQKLSESGSRPLQSVFSWKEFPFIVFDDGKVKLYDKRSNRISELTFGALKDAVLWDDHTIYLALNKGIIKVTFDENYSFITERLENLDARTYSVERDNASSDLFIATSEGLKIMKGKGKIENYYFKDELVFANDIFADERSVYIATKDQGILVYESGKFVRQIFPQLNNLPVEITKLVVRDDKFYTLSSNGFVVFDEKGVPELQLNKVHGFSTNKIFDFEISGKYIWMTHSKGIHQLNLDLLKVRKQIPEIHFNAITFNNEKMDIHSGNNRFGYDVRNFKFVFSSPTLRNKENIRYHYRLKGYNDEWQTVDYFENEITYNALAPGDYTFLVKAENQGVFSETISYSFTISAPVYLRWWFITGLSLVILIIISLIYRNKLVSQRKKAKQQNELNASKLTAIQSQMNPHFIFNSLNSIQDLVLKGDIDNSYAFITKFSDLVRRTLSYSEKDFIEFEQEMKLIELYLTLEKLRFKEELEYVIDLDGVEDIMIPPMLIQPFIENALLHGLLHKEGLKKLKIEFRLEELLICEIMDNGVGRKKSAEIKNRQRADHESFASNAIKKRFEILSEHFQNKLGFEYEDLSENGISIGTKVTLFIPVKHKF